MEKTPLPPPPEKKTPATKNNFGADNSGAEARKNWLPKAYKQI